MWLIRLRVNCHSCPVRQIPVYHLILVNAFLSFVAFSFDAFNDYSVSIFNIHVICLRLCHQEEQALQAIKLLQPVEEHLFVAMNQFSIVSGDLPRHAVARALGTEEDREFRATIMPEMLYKDRRCCPH